MLQSKLFWGRGQLHRQGQIEPLQVARGQSCPSSQAYFLGFSFSKPEERTSFLLGPWFGVSHHHLFLLMRLCLLVVVDVEKVRVQQGLDDASNDRNGLE